jgi:hypothetical protein
MRMNGFSDGRVSSASGERAPPRASKLGVGRESSAAGE